MKINRRYGRSVKSNLSFYISATVLTIVALLMYLVFSIGGRGILHFVDDFFESQKVEDAEFITYLELSNDDVEQLSEDFNIVLERQNYFNFDEEDYTVRVFGRNQNVNLYDVTEGEDAIDSDDIIISQGYAENMSVDIGDEVTVNGKEYTVSGYFERPDYLYMLQNITDSAKNNSTFFLAYVSDEEFETLGEPVCNYAVRYNEDNESEFRKHINDEFKIVTYLNQDENSRISELRSQPDTFISMSYCMLIFVPCIVVALIAVIIGRMVKKEQKLIGTLMALGYRKKTLVRHYAGFAFIPGIIGGVLSVVLVTLCAQPFGKACLADYEPIQAKFSVQPYEMVLCIIIPTIMYVLSAGFTVRKLLKKNVVLLLSGNTDSDKKKVKELFVNSKMHFRKKFAFRSILLNKSRSFVVFLGIFVGGFIMMFALSFMDSLGSIVDVGGNDIGSFEYEYVMNYLMNEEYDNAEPVILTSFERTNGSSFFFMGIDEDENEYITLKDTSGKELELGDGFIITSLAAKAYNIRVGDTFKFCDGNTLEEYEVEISGISKNNFQKCLYASMENARTLLDWDDGYYNALQSTEELDVDENAINFTVTKKSIEEQMETIIDQMAVIVYVLIFLGVIICICSIYVTVNMLVDENKVNISMLKVLGYRNKEIDKMILKVNNVLLILGIVLSIPAAYMADYAYFQSMADSMGCIIPVICKPISMCITAILVVICYYVSLMMLKRKVYRVNAVESLKDNRE